MQIQSINADAELAVIVSSIGQTPQSWRGWSCVHVAMDTEDQPVGQDLGYYVWAQSVLESYLKDIEGRAFFCNARQIHVICKGVPLDVLEQMAGQLCDLLLEADSLLAHYAIYDLEADGEQYAEMFFEHAGNFAPQRFETLSVKVLDSQSFVADKADLFERATSLSACCEKLNVHTKKVLLVEDDPVTRWMVRKSLKDACEFATAPTAHQAFAMLQSYQPDIVFLDIDLPDMSGQEVLEWAMRNDPGICVVMFSANSTLDYMTETLNTGAKGFISKPFVRDDLLRYVRAGG